jgi:uncharacterized protein YjcR
MAELTNKQKKEWAKMVYTIEGLNQKDTAHKVEVSLKTINKWVNDEKWDNLKANFIVSKESNLKRIYAQINEINTAIENKPEGQRYANSKEADTLVKLASAAKTLETDNAISDIINAFTSFNEWLRVVDLNTVKLLVNYQDDFIKSKLR